MSLKNLWSVTVHASRAGFFARHLGEPNEPRERVRRNLERLLNTKCRVRLTDNDWRIGTLAAYGMPDLADLDPTNPASRQTLCMLISTLIATWEPRITSVSVTVIEDTETPVDALRLRIDAEWSSVPVGFEAIWKRDTMLTLD